MCVQKDNNEKAVLNIAGRQSVADISSTSKSWRLNTTDISIKVGALFSPYAWDFLPWASAKVTPKLALGFLQWDLSVST